MASPLISASGLRARLLESDRDPGSAVHLWPIGPEISIPPALLDVRWDVVHGARRDQFAAGHIPGAVFVDLGGDLAGHPAPDGVGGRHPLPDPEAFVSTMRAAGVSRERPVVVYDGTGGLAGARAWWLLRHYGHPEVMLLDGGLEAWRAAGTPPLATGPGELPAPGEFAGAPGAMPVLDATDAASLARRELLLDARTAERFRGESEPVDSVAGHIPGARNRPTTANLAPDGRFLSPSQLRSQFGAAGARDGVTIGVYCGSGVTAAHQVLALEVAGLAAALYPGSWSDWVSDPARPVATGD